MKNMKYIAAAILLATTVTAHAADATTTLPGDKGISSVNKNLEKNPDNKGLQNAAAQLEKNRIKHEEQAEKRSENQEQHMEKSAEIRAERHDSAATRPPKVDRPGN